MQHFFLHTYECKISDISQVSVALLIQLSQSTMCQIFPSKEDTPKVLS